MTNDIQQSGTEQKPIPFGMRLQSAREALGLERKDVAAQLRLNEKVIIMMEKDRYAPDLPVTFIRGYIRSYGKFLQLPESEIKKALEPIKPKVSQPDSANPAKIPILATPAVTSGNYFMQFFTFLIVCTLTGLVGMWWYTHPTASIPLMAENQLTQPPQTTPINSVAAPVAPETRPIQIADNTNVIKSAITPALEAVAPLIAAAKITPAEQPPVATKPVVATAPRHTMIARAKPAKPAVPVVDLNDTDNNETNSTDDAD